MCLTSLVLAGLVVLAGSPATLAKPTVASAAVAGIWELTGIGGHNNVSTPQRFVLELTPGGEFRISTWEASDPAPQRVTGRYVVRDDLLELRGPGTGDPEVFRIAWEASVLVLGPFPEDRRTLPLRFERRPWISP